MAHSGFDPAKNVARRVFVIHRGFVSLLMAVMCGCFVAVTSAEAIAGAGVDGPSPPTVDFSRIAGSADVQKKDFDGSLHPVRARLVADRDQVVPGETFRLGVHLDQAEGWHTYWKSPGENGQATQIAWSLPPGWTHEPYEFPIPLRFDEEGMVSYGYNNEVLFFSEVTVSEDQVIGSMAIGAEVVWTVCEEVCILGDASLKFSLPVVGAASAPNRFAPLFDHYAERHPTPLGELESVTVDAAVSVDGVRPNDTFQVLVRLTGRGDANVSAPITVGSWPAFTPIANLDGMILESSVEVDGDGAVIARLDLEAFEPESPPAGEIVGGLFQVEVDGRSVQTEVILEVPWVAAGTPVQPSASPLFGSDLGAPSVGAAETQPVAAQASGFASMLFMAFLGGLLLNIMPCVLPVLTLKLYGLIEQVDVGARERRVAGVAYSLGIVASFLALAVGVIVSRTLLGDSVLWGFQFQYPAYVAALATIVWVFGLSLFGIFEVPAFGATQASQASDKEGAVGYFLTGVFATLLATPCSAPFLGTGMGFAFSLPSSGILLFFAVAGLGLAFPFLVIALVPALYRFLPRPGAWMETFKELMGFTLLATALWLIDVLMGQVGVDGGIGFLAFLLFVSVGAWVVGKWGGPIESRNRQLLSLAAAVLISVGGGRMFLDLEMASEPVDDSGALSMDLDFSESMPWQAFSEDRIEGLAGTPVFVDFTADWCLTCKVNEKTVLETATVRNAMAELGVVPLKADWTRKDEVISRWLQRYGKAGVPFYLVIPADRSKPNDPLGEVITPEGVVEALRRATD